MWYHIYAEPICDNIFCQASFKTFLIKKLKFLNAGVDF